MLRAGLLARAKLNSKRKSAPILAPPRFAMQAVFVCLFWEFMWRLLQDQELGLSLSLQVHD